MAAPEIELLWASQPEEVHTAFELRESVFCVEQGVPREQELDGLDDRAMHLLALETGGGRTVGTLRLLVDGRRARIGRVAVTRAWRRRGVASRMLGAALTRALEHGCEHAVLAAQLDATSLYEHAGFRVESKPFLQAGIMHVSMRRRL